MIRWSLTRAVPPSTIVTLAEVKDQARVTTTAEDNLLTSFWKAAEAAVEDELARSLLTQTWLLRLDRFPCWTLPLPRPGLVSVSTVQYVDGAGVLQTLAGTEYTVDVADGEKKAGRIMPAYGKVWPTTRDEPNAVRVTYIAGYSSAANVPELIKTAIRMTAAEMYAHRERSAEQVLQQLEFYERLVGNHRCVTEFNYD